jgi:hypothetical protein
MMTRFVYAVDRRACAICYRSEKLVLAKWPGKMKPLSTLVCVSGAMIVSVFKGRLLHLWPTHLLRYSHASPASPSNDDGVHHGGMAVVGTLLLCGSCLSYAVYGSSSCR